MDDLVPFADEKDTLWQAKAGIEAYLHQRLHLRIKMEAVLLAPVTQGLPFLGFRIFPNIVRLSRKGWRRFRRKVVQREAEHSRGEIEDEQWARSMSSLIGHMQQANTRNLRAYFFEGQGHKRHEPGYSRRQLEQQCAQLPVGHS